MWGQNRYQIIVNVNSDITKLLYIFHIKKCLYYQIICLYNRDWRENIILEEYQNYYEAEIFITD